MDLMFQGKGKDEFPPTLPMDLTPVCESNIISIMMLNEARGRPSLVSDDTKVK